MSAPHLLAAIMNLGSLEFLLLEGFTLRPPLLQHLSRLTKLESLVLLQSRIADAECATIAGFVSPNLRNLSLRGSKVTTEGIAMLAERLTDIEELDIVKTYVCMYVVSLSFLGSIRWCTLESWQSFEALIAGAGISNRWYAKRALLICCVGCYFACHLVPSKHKSFPACEHRTSHHESLHFKFVHCRAINLLCPI